MFYNQNFENSYNLNSRNNNCEKDEKHNNKKGYCTVKVIQECCYPSYWDYEEKTKDDKHNNCDKHEDRKEEKCCCHREEKQEEHKCCCQKEDKWEDKDSYQDSKCRCKQRNSCCGFCSCFRRW